MHTEYKMSHIVNFKYNYENASENINCKTGIENAKDKVFVCNICEKNFHSKANLTDHLNSHNSSVNNAEDDYQNVNKQRQNICNICYKKFTAKKNLLKHLRDIHKNYQEAEKMVVKKIKCPERNCEFMCRMMRELRDHVVKCHKIKILKDTLEFSNEAVFQKWKKEEETNAVSFFVSGRKKTTLSDGTKRQTLYCHRTGYYHPKGFKKHRRSIGSCKIGVTCPAAMEITEFPDGQLSVIYYKTHLGHMQDVVYLKLSREERAHLAEKIKQGFTFDAILEDVKESTNPKNSKTKRIHLLSKKDLYSIMRSVNNNNRKKKRNEVSERNGEIEPKEPEGIQENLVIRNLETEKTVAQNFSGYSGQSVISSGGQPDADSGLSRYEKLEKDFSVPQTSGEGVTSQIVILSPDLDYTSVAEIVLLSAGETASYSSVFPQDGILEREDCSVRKTEDPTPEIAEVTTEGKNKINKSNLRLQLQEKINEILKFLPETEFLTPKQFDLINAKLDGVLNIFHLADSKAKTKKQNSKKKTVKKFKILNKWDEPEEAVTNKMEETVLGQQIFENPLVYAVYN